MLTGMKAVAAAVLVLTVGCTADDEPDDMTMSEAWCSDLRAGQPPLGMMMGAINSGQYADGREAADAAYGMTGLSCPEQLASNELLRVYLESFGINPDG